jgi:uncharacterized protein YkwD
MIRTLAVMLLTSVLLVHTAVTAFAAEDYSTEIAELSSWLDGLTLTPSGGGSAPANTPGATTPAPTALTADELGAYADKMLALVNKERVNAGAAPLERDDLLAEAAMLRAAEIKVVDEAGGLPHTRPDGTSYTDLLDSLGVTGSLCGENIARAEPTPEAAVQALMASDGHRKNILRADYGTIGVGVYQREDGKLNWVQIFMLQ